MSNAKKLLPSKKLVRKKKRRLAPFELSSKFFDVSVSRLTVAFVTE